MSRSVNSPAESCLPRGYVGLIVSLAYESAARDTTRTLCSAVGPLEIAISVSAEELRMNPANGRVLLSVCGILTRVA
jgi:hypothetical protein